MCGLVGLLTFKAGTEEFYRDVITSMAGSVVHRGPDGSGEWVDADAGIALGHRRLAVVELSEHGAQPMVSHGGRYVVSYNGEIYNHLEIRQRLQAEGQRNFSGGSDTETLLAAIENWGVAETLKSLNGMFAFALWDKRERTLVLARDRLGIKPLLYGMIDGHFVFSSELRAFHQYPGFNGDIDRQALDELLRYTVIGAPRTIYKQINKLEPGAFICVSADELSRMGRVEAEYYWHLCEVVAQGFAQPFGGDGIELLDELERLLRSSIRGQMLSDVPLGCFLSGGIDSSAVVALMQAESTQPVKTFTIGFDEDAYDEARYARKVAAHIGTDHHELYLTLNDAQDIVPNLADLCDEPFGDSSILPTYLVSRLARETVTVSLSGDGGDELFGGYNRHISGSAIWRHSQKIPALMSGVLRASIHSLSPAKLNALAGGVSKLLPGVRLPRAPADKLYKIADILGFRNVDGYYDAILSRWPRADSLVVGVESTRCIRRMSGLNMDVADVMMLKDQYGYLPDDILAKVDHASMAVSLESRVPLLDHRLVEFAWQIPLSAKILNGQGKLPLRKILDKYVPPALLDRPKVGFGLPIHDWLRGGLRDWAESLLEPGRLRNQGYFDVDKVQRIWHDHLNGRHNHQHLIWNILSFQAWYKKKGEA